jgi:hypothetical protein
MAYKYLKIKNKKTPIQKTPKSLDLGVFLSIILKGYKLSFFDATDNLL